MSGYRVSYFARVKCFCKRHHSQMKTITDDGCTYSETIRKSRFVCFARHVKSVERVHDILNDLRDGKANHHCWAYKIGECEKCNDGDEPAGSAGSPILSAIKSNNLHNVLVVVLRYFGGVKLGMGGLIRAYGGVARKCLAECQRVECVQRQILEVRVDISNIDKIYCTAAISPTAKIIFEEFIGNQVTVKLEIDSAVSKKFQDILNSSTRGDAEIE